MEGSLPALPQKASSPLWINVLLPILLPPWHDSHPGRLNGIYGWVQTSSILDFEHAKSDTPLIFSIHFPWEGQWGRNITPHAFREANINEWQNMRGFIHKSMRSTLHRLLEILSVWGTKDTSQQHVFYSYWCEFHLYLWLGEDWGVWL